MKHTIADYWALTPSERLLIALFGMPKEEKHWLSHEGELALAKVLLDWNSNLSLSRPSMREKGLRVILLRFGFEPRADGQLRGRTRREVGEYFGVTSERIRQLECKALRCLRHPKYSDRLKPYLEGYKLLPHCTNDEAYEICLRTPSVENCKGCPSWK